MNYIDLSRHYWKLNQQEAFLPSDTHVYYCLVNAFNAKGTKSDWPETVTYTDGAFADIAGLNTKTMDGARNRLIKRGLITTDGNSQGKRKGVTYRLTSPNTSPVSYPKNGEVNGELIPEPLSTSPTNGEVDASLLQQPVQQLTQQLIQKTEKSIYKEVQTPDSQTPDFFLQQAARPPEEIYLAEEKKKEEAPAPPTPSPPPVSSPPKPIPIPAGKVYGDGVLQAEVVAYYRDNPDQFPRSIYLPFLAWWSKKKQKGDIALIGSEMWRTVDWDIATRLDKWNTSQYEKNQPNGSTTTDFLARQRAAEPQTIDDYGDF